MTSEFLHFHWVPHSAKFPNIDCWASPLWPGLQNRPAQNMLGELGGWNLGLGTPGTWAEELQHVGKILGQMQGIHVFYILFPVAWIWKETDWRLNAGRIWRCLALSRKMIRVFLFSSAMISLVAYDLILRQSQMCGRKMLPSWPFLVDRNTSTEFQHTVANAATAAVKKTR